MSQDPLNKLLKVLLVENSRTARAALSKQLISQEYEVEAVASGVEAIKALKGQHYDVIVMDVFMPEMNGYEAAKLIRNLPDKKKANTPIIALTASKDERDKEICFTAGINDFILKTIDNAPFFETLNRYRHLNK